MCVLHGLAIRDGGEKKERKKERKKSPVAKGCTLIMLLQKERRGKEGGREGEEEYGGCWGREGGGRETGGVGGVQRLRWI